MPTIDEMSYKIIGCLQAGEQPSTGVLISLKEVVDTAVTLLPKTVQANELEAEFEALGIHDPGLVRQILPKPGDKATFRILKSTDGGRTFC